MISFVLFRERLENCLICLDDKTSLEMATVKGCLHKFCVVCMKQHAATQVQANQVPVRCPQVLISHNMLSVLIVFLSIYLLKFCLYSMFVVQ